MRSYNNHIKHSNQRGASAVYMLCLLPALIAITFALIDIAKWNSLRDTLIQEAAAIAKLSAETLPDTEAVSASIRQSTTSLQNRLPELANITVTPFFDNNNSSAAIGVKIDATYIPGLAKLGNSLIPSLDLKMRISKSATAQYRPGDYVLIISNAHTLRPRNQSDIFQPQSQNLPPANIFRCSKPYSTGSWLSGWDNPNSALFFTQACYNPPFLALKLASIALLDAISEIKNNNVTAIFSPGDSEYQDSFGLNNIACILFSQDYLGTNPYKLLSSSAEEEILNSNYRFCPTQIELSRDILDQEYLNQPLPLRQAIYWQIAREQTVSDWANMDIHSAVNAALDNLLNKTAEQRQNEFLMRGNLAINPKRHIFVFADTLNGYQPTSELINILHENNIKLTFIIYSHEFLNSAISAQNITDFIQLQSDIAMMNAEGHDNITAYLTSDSSELFEIIMPQALSHIKQVFMREYGN